MDSKKKAVVSQQSGMNGSIGSHSNGHLYGPEKYVKDPGDNKNSGRIALIHCLRILSVFNKLFQRNLRFRDRSVKVVQYGCQMLNGWFTEYFSPEMNEGITILRRTASNSRKWMWFLKSVQHVFWLYHKTLSKKTMSIVEKYDYSEQIFLVMYYFYENLVLFSRLKIPGFVESKLDFGCNLTWFLGDVFLTCSASTSLHHKLRQIRAVKSRLEEIRAGLSSLGEESSKSIVSSKLLENINPVRAIENLILFSTDTFASLLALKPELKLELDGTSLEELEEQLQLLYVQRTDAYISYLIALFEVGVSAHCTGFLKLVGQQHPVLTALTRTGDGSVGFMGVMSSSLILLQYYRGLPR